MTDIALVSAAILFLLAAGFFSGSEMGMYCINRVQLRLYAERQHLPGAQTLLHLVNRRQETVLAILLWQNVCAYLLTVATSFWLAHLAGMHPQHVEFYSALILSPLVLIDEVLPKNWFRIEADRLMYFCAPILRWSVELFRITGVLWLLQQLSKLAARYIGPDEREDWLGTRGEILGLLREGAAGGAITEEQTQIVERVLNLSRVQLRSIMIPRRRVVTVPIDADRRLVETIVRGHPFSRMPVLARDRRGVAGIIGVAHLLAEAEQAEFSVERSMKPPLTINPGESATNALVQLQQAGATMAIVHDPRQGFLGIVTLKDIVEEIFGELPAW